MNLTLNISSSRLHDEDLQSLTRELYNEIKENSDIQASLPTQKSANSKGSLVELSVIALAFLGSALLEIIKALINRQSSVEIAR